MRPTRSLLCAATVVGCLTPATADAASIFTIRGAGFGHGVGMSQYGAYGYALHDWSYDRILAHYYTGTSLAVMPKSTVRVLLQAAVGTARFSGASSAAGRFLDPAKT
jgi:stage II sporulation protein D